MAFGQQWLNDWEAEKDADVEVHYPPKLSKSDLDIVTEIGLSELSTVLNSGYARRIAEKIATRVVNALGSKNTLKT